MFFFPPAYFFYSILLYRSLVVKSSWFPRAVRNCFTLFQVLVSWGSFHWALFYGTAVLFQCTPFGISFCRFSLLFLLWTAPRIFSLSLGCRYLWLQQLFALQLEHGRNLCKVHPLFQVAVLLVDWCCVVHAGCRFIIRYFVHPKPLTDALKVVSADYCFFAAWA